MTDIVVINGETVSDGLRYLKLRMSSYQCQPGASCDDDMNIERDTIVGLDRCFSPDSDLSETFADGSILVRC